MSGLRVVATDVDSKQIMKLEKMWSDKLAEGDMAYDYGAVNITNPDGTKKVSRYVVIWTRENGEWKVAVDIFN